MADVADPDQALLDVLWGEGAPGRRGPKPRVSLDEVVDAGIALADEEGLPGLTMQRVGERLGLAKMSLYRHVPGRAELIALMADRALGEPDAAPRDRWRPALRAWTLGVCARELAHPWSTEVLQQPHVPGPHELAWFEAGLRALDGLALTGAERLEVLTLLVGHAGTIARQRAAREAPGRDLAAAVAAVLATRADRFPHTADAFAEAPGGDALEFGIERVLDGIDALLGTRATPGAPTRGW